MAEQPFIVGGCTESPYFFGRNDEIDKIKQDILSAKQNIIIIGPQRIGKTSLLRNLKSHVHEDTLFTYINCRMVTNIDDLFRLMTLSTIKVYEDKHKTNDIAERLSKVFNENITKAVKSLSDIGGSIERAGQAYIQFRENDLSEEELILETFEFIKRFSTETKELIVIAFDEFQELSKLNEDVLHILNGCTNSNVSFIFSVSSRSILNSVFLKPDSPLYSMTSIIKLDSIRKEYACDYISSRLEKQNIEISLPALDKIYTYTGGFPFYIQKMGIILYLEANLKNKNLIDVGDVDIGFSTMLNELDGEFEEKYSANFSLQQQTILKHLSQNKERKLSEIATDMQTPSSSLTRSIKDLHNTMAIHRPKKGTYGILDTVFRVWIKRNILAEI
ncbi:MAG: uncharacterized protein PWQ44_2310 [Methanolobus sp.]|jgi:AAA+ ATPase superfamily predicted ATPase|nr:uncharacterized protein [Methanolobus sp.]